MCSQILFNHHFRNYRDASIGCNALELPFPSAVQRLALDYTISNIDCRLSRDKSPPISSALSPNFAHSLESSRIQELGTRAQAAATLFFLISCFQLTISSCLFFKCNYLFSFAFLFFLFHNHNYSDCFINRRFCLS